MDTGVGGCTGGLACGADSLLPIPAASPNACSSGTGRSGVLHWDPEVLPLTWEVATGSPCLSFPTCSQQDRDPDLTSTPLSQGRCEV